MKRINIIYWISTILFAAYMIFSAIPDAMLTEQAVQFVHEFLGYPVYFIQFIGVAKILGSIAILVPGIYRLKEWAYAGLIFDLVGATYSIISVKPDAMGMVFMTVTIAVGMISYFYMHKRRKLMAVGEILH